MLILIELTLYGGSDIIKAVKQPILRKEWRRLDDKHLLAEKYKLKYENNAWYSEWENSHKHLIFKETFFEKSDIIGLLFRINKLCTAKVKYFRAHIDEYEPMRYHYKNGFYAVPLWDADFLRHRASGYILDFRILQGITDYDDFAALCRELEGFESGK